MTRTPKGHKPFLTAVIRFLLVGMLVFAAARAWVWAQVWSWPRGQSPINTPGQPPTTGSFTNLLKKSPSTLQVVMGSAKTAAVSSMPGFFGNPVAGATIAVIGQNSFTTFPSIPKPAGNVGVYGYAAGNGYGLFGTTPPAAVAGYGVAGDVSSVSGVAGHFLGAVTVLTNGSAKGDLTADGRMTADKGFECLEASGCKIDDDSTAMRISNDAGAHGLFSYSTAFSGISINNTVASKHCSLNVYATCTSDAQCTGANGTTCIHDGKSLLAFGTNNVGLSGYGATGGISIATQGGDDAYTYRALVGSAVVPNTPTDSFSGRIGVQGMTTGGMGNAVSYTSSPPNYDLASGVRACVKDTAGNVVNKYGIVATGGIYAGYFYRAATGGTCAIGGAACTQDSDCVSGGYDGTMSPVIDPIGAGAYHTDSILLDSANRPVILYGSNPGGMGSSTEFKVVRCGNADCTSGNAIWTTGLLNIFDFQLGMGTYPYVVYQDKAQTYDIYLLACDSTDCANTPSKAAGDGQSGLTLRLPRFARASNGFHAIAYVNVVGTGWELYVTRCKNSSCTQFKTSGVLDILPASAQIVGIQIASDDFPVISYYDDNPWSLKVYKCTASTATNPCSAGGFQPVVTPIGGFDTGPYDMNKSSLILSPTTGFPIISYSTDPGTGAKQVEVVRCGNANCSTIASGPNFIGTHCDIVAYGSNCNYEDFAETASIAMSTTDNKPVILYNYFQYGKWKIAKCGDESCSANNIVTPINSFGDALYDIAVPSDTGFPVMSCYDYLGGLTACKCHSTACSSGGVCQLTYGANDGRMLITGSGNTVVSPPAPMVTIHPNGSYVSMAKSNDGYPIISFKDRDANQLRAIKCKNNDCSSRDNNLLLTLPASNFPYSSIAVTPALGYPIVSYYEVSGQDLWIIKCTSTNCLTVSAPLRIQSTSGTNNAGQNNKMMIGSDGLPIVAYEFNGDIAVIHCGNDSCTSGNSGPNIVNDGGALNDVLGSSIFIAIDKATGFPVISYTGRTQSGWLGFFEVSHCNNLTCDPALAPIDNVKIESFGDNSNQYAPTSIASDGAGSFPSVVYGTSAFYNEKMRFARCTNSSCSTRASGNPTFLHPTRKLYSTFSLGISPVGNLPVMGTVDGDNSNRFTVIKCANTECTGTNTITTIDTDVDATSGRVIFQDSTSYPTFVYTTGNTTGAEPEPVKVLACQNHDCTPVSSGGGPLGAVLRIGNTYLTKCNLIGMLRKAGITQFPACP